jgi:heme/copper-type cytochrome/quinol oxidase subunit 2
MMDGQTLMDDQAKQAFTSASDWSKQILTLSTAIVTLTVSFADKIFGDLSRTEKWFLWIAWVLYIVAIVGGVWFLSALTGTLASAKPPSATAVYGSNTRIPAFVQLVPFVLATLAIVIFGFLSVGNTKTPATKTGAAVPIEATRL